MLINVFVIDQIHQAKIIDDTANDADMNMSNESDESDDLIIKSYVFPPS